MSKVSGATDLANELAQKRGISKTEAQEVVKDLVEIMASAIVNGGVSFKGVMTIKPKLRKGRTGKISFGDKKGQQWKTEDKYVLEVTTGKVMDEELN